MSDFFMPTQKSEYWNKKQEEQKTQQADTTGKTEGGFWDKKTESYNQAKEQHYGNWNRYGVEVPDEYYSVFNQIIGKAESPEQAQEEAYRIGSAVKYAQMYGMPLDEAYKNVDAFNEAQFTKLTGQKARYEALSDMFTLGKNNVKLGELGHKLMKAHRENDTEMANALMAEIDTIYKRNQLLQDNAPRSWVMEALEAGAQSLPFTGAVAGAGIIGNFIAPAVGTGAAFLTSSYLSSGQEYIDALANGATPETARTISMISGGIQGLIEADLGITSGIVKGTARVMGKKAAKNAAEKAVEKIGQKVFKRFHFGAGKKLVLNYLAQHGKNVLGEGTEEFLQELTSIAGQEVMAALDGYDIPDDDAKHIVKQVAEAFRGGVLGALSLGFIPAGLNTRAEIKEFKKVKETAEAVESPEAFHNLVKENPIFEGMGEENLKSTTREIWERAQQRKEEAINEKAKEILETTDYAEGAEEREVNEQGEEEPLDDVARNEEGRLDIQDDETKNEDGSISGTFRAGDRSKEKDNRYGYINYTANEADKTVTIDAFKMADGREGLRGELFDEFSRKYAGYKIEWNTIKPAAQKIKESLIENNPNGKKAGLSYYSDEDISDIQTRKRVATELRQNIYSIEQVTDENGNVSYVKKELSNKQVAAGIALLESAAKRMGMSLSDYVDKTFSSRIFATEKEFEDAVAAQGDTTTGKAGAMEWKRFGQEVKAVIYAGENADFSTWVHELAHVFQSQLTGDLKAQAEKAFNVIDGDWIGSKFTFADGHTDSAAEAFAYGFQDWLKTGRAESEELKNIFQKFAEFLARAFNALKKHIDFTPEIEEVYNQLLAGDDSIMAKAEKAAEEEDRAYRAKMKADEEAKQAAAQKEAEDAKKAEAAEREEKSEVTEYAEENADKVTEAEKKLDEVTNEESETENNAIDNALENLNLTDEQKEEVAEVLKNPDETQQAKAGAIVDAASESAYGEDEDESFESLGDMLFQKSKIIPIGKGDFGNIYDCFKGRPNQAIAFLISQQGGEAIGALHHKDIGDIDLVWGEEGTGHSDGYGLSKLAKYHPEVLANLQEILDSMTVTDRSKNRVQLESKTHKAGVRLTWNGKNKNWLLTAFEKDSDVSDSRTDIAGTENGSKNDTATLANTANNDNTTTNENVNKTLFQIAGEIGAANLDKNEEVAEGVSRMQNLAIAKEMETANKDAKEIRLATGWEKGNDGKWKFEIPDLIINRDFYFDKIDEGYRGKNFNLSDVIKANELFTAYPQLKNIEVAFMPLSSGIDGSYNKDTNVISISSNIIETDIAAPEKIESILAHEIQHAIQRIEGFARGGNKEEFKPLMSEEDIRMYKDVLIGTANRNRDKADEIKDRINADINADKLLQDFMPKIRSGEETLDSWFDYLEKQQMEHPDYEEYKKYKLKEEEATEEASQLGKYQTDSGEWITPGEAYLRLAGETESRNVETRMKLSPAERVNKLLKETEDVSPVDKIILFQTVYHGSGANFDKFNTEQYGLSGEGSMSFGYGTYLTDSEEIARDYAERNRKQFDKYADNPYERGTLEREIFEDLRSFDFDKTKYKAYLEQQIKDFKAEPDNPYIDNKASGKLSKLDSINATNLYTVEIPDDGYLEWDKKAGVRNVRKIAKALEEKNKNITYWLPNHIKDLPMEGKLLYTINNQSKTGKGTNEDLYEALSIILGNEKEASKFLHSLGYAGIKYPAGTIHGNGNGAYNYVIFNDEDAKIIDHLLFQTQEELYKDARDFDSWQDFMEFYEQHGKRLEEDTAVPYTADENWYKDTWNMAQSVKKDEEQQTEQKAAAEEENADTPELMDDIFISYVRKDPAVLDNFLKMIAAITKEDLSSEEWAHMDEEGARERERIELLKEFIEFKLNSGNWRTAINAVEAGKELEPGLRKRIMSELTDRYKVREYRDIYASIMQQKRFRVNELDTRAAELYRQYAKHEKRYYDIAMPDDLEFQSPQKLKNIAEELHNHDMKVKIKAGVIPLDNELDNYFKSLEKKDNDRQKELERLINKVNNAYMHIANEERKLLVRTHEKLLDLQNRKENVSKTVQERIANPLKKGLRLTERYQRELEDMETSYHEVFRKFSDLKDSLEITDDLKEILDAQEQAAKIKAEVQEITEEKNRVDEIKKIRLNLVKRTLRKVDLSKVDFANARKIIAIQRMIEPNIIGGINRWIGRKNPVLKTILTQILTDSDYKEQILRYLRAQKNDTQVFQDFYKSLENATKLEDFESWGIAEESYAIKHLPKENWVRWLNLAELAEERRKTLQLDITTKEVERPVYDEEGYPVMDANGKQQTEKTYVLEFSNEIGQMVKDAVGDELFDKIVNQSFVTWTTDDLLRLAQVVNNLHKEGVELRKAKILARKREAQGYRKLIEDTVRNTGIVINDDDPPEIKAKKEKKIAKILGKSKDFKGTEAAKKSGFLAKLDRLFNGYDDANMLRVARILDGNKEGANYQLLYRQENDCFSSKQRSIVKRSEAVKGMMKDNKINEFELASIVEVKELGTKFSVDELLYFLAADKDFEEDESKVADGLTGLAANDDFAPTSRNAVMFGVMGSDSATQEQKQAWAELDKDLKDAEMEDLINRTPGAQQYISLCKERWSTVLKAANKFLEENPKFYALMQVIQNDYADQYERMNEVSINEFNLPVNRVNCYVPLVRLEANGETNEKQVQEDLLRAYGQDRAGVNKGMTQQRKKISPLNQKPVQTGLFKTWASSVERTEHFIAYAPYVKLLRDVYTGRDSTYTRGIIESRYGKYAVEYIDNYISEVANPNAGKIIEAGSEFLHTLRGRTAPAYLGWKASGIIKQGLTSPWPYMQFVNPAEYLAACVECLTPGKKIYDTIKEKSVFMKTRSFDPMKDLVDEVKENAKSKLDKNWSKITAMGMQGLEWIDWACVAPGWYACYKKEYARLQKANEAKIQNRIAELTEKNAGLEPESEGYLTEDKIKAKAYQEYTDDLELLSIQYADDCTRQCQPSSRLSDLAPMFKGKSEAMKAFLQFQTSLNVIWQNIRYDIPYAVRQKEFARIAGTVFGYVLAGIFMNSVMDGLMGDDGEDKDLQALRNLIFYSTTQFTDAIPMLGSEFTNFMDIAITGKRNFASSGTDMTPTATKLLNALTKATKGDFKKAAALTAEGIGLGLGAPVSGTKEIYKLLGKPFKEGDVNLKRGVGDVYGFMGDILGE